MDYELLVEDKIEDGKALIQGLLEDGFDVSVAFWVRAGEDHRSFLYLASDMLRAMSLADAYRAVYSSLMRRVPSTEISLSNITVVGPDDPIAKAAMKVRDRYPARVATRYNGERLGDMAIEEAYIYPRAGDMSRREILQTVTSLMDRTGGPAPSMVSMRDGTQFQAVPVGIQMNPPGAIHIVFHDLAASTDRSVLADDVMNIM